MPGLPILIARRVDGDTRQSRSMYSLDELRSLKSPPTRCDLVWTGSSWLATIVWATEQWIYADGVLVDALRVTYATLDAPAPDFAAEYTAPPIGLISSRCFGPARQAAFDQLALHEDADVLARTIDSVVSLS